MQPSLNRRLLVLLILSTGALMLPGNAGAETYPFSDHDLMLEAALVPVEPSEPASSSTFRMIEIEMGITYPSEKQGESELGSAADPFGDPWDPPVGMPIIQAEPEPAARKRAPTYEVPDRPEVHAFVDRFQTGYRRAVVERWLTRAGRYVGMIREILAQRGLPEELLCTVMIESGFDPVAVSRAGAKGLWQFMAPTARRYGLRVDRWMDERLDPEKSTRAAAAYLKDLYAAYGSWPLAHAAYNGGDVRIQRAVRALKSTNFWDLTRGRHLAEETKNFVPAIQAAILIVRDPELYGFSVTPAEPLRYETIRVAAGTRLARLADEAKLEAADLTALNPELRLAQTPPGEPYSLKVPVGGADKVRAVLEREAAKRMVASAGTGRAGAAAARALPDGVHVVKPQDTVGGIAKRYGVSVAEVRRWNRLSEEARIFPGDRLRVALASPAAREEGQGGFR
jgi:membrane-bound lytic murein transglycosylase D